VGEVSQSLCQPDGAKGCSLCCGLFNFKDLSREHLGQFLEYGNNRHPSRDAGGIDSAAGPFSQVRDRTSYLCTHQGFVSKGKPGCLVHPRYRAISGRDSSLFGEKICDSFLCPAHSILNEEQKRTIVAHIDDWYYYAFAVADPASVQWFLAVLSDRFYAAATGSAFIKKALAVFLEIHARYLKALSGPIFFYSVPEYNIGSKDFSLGYESPRLQGEKKEILEAIGKNL
jgi:hypothetical protein